MGLSVATAQVAQGALTSSMLPTRAHTVGTFGNLVARCGGWSQCPDTRGDVGNGQRLGLVAPTLYYPAALDSPTIGEG